MHAPDASIPMATAKKTPDVQKSTAPQPEAVPGGETVDPADSHSLSTFMAMLDGLTDACMVVEPDGRMRYANEAARTLLRMKGRATGRKIAAVLAERQALEIFENAAAAERPRIAVLALTFSSDGARSYTVSAVPVRIEGEGLFYRIALSPSSAPIPQTGANETTALLQKLGDPLSILQGYLENLLDGVIKEPALMRQCLSAMQRQTTQMQRLLTGLRV
jgi:nitrogen-specific signal transduction histidine kinase